MNQVAVRQQLSRKNVGELRKKLDPHKSLFKDKACIYATGSYGRCEASEFSDLDVFIIGKTTEEATKNGDKNIRKRHLSYLDEICLKAKLIEVTSCLGFPKFSNDGRYLQYFSNHDLIKTLGTENDDVSNTFTARLLLILESCALCEEELYEEFANQVIGEYWRDFEGHEDDFVPAFFANDILRLWRTFCVNYEARTNRNSDEDKAEGKLKNYKLKHSRLMTCYSAIIYLLAIYRKNRTVRKEDAISLFRLHPIDRLKSICKNDMSFDANNLIHAMLDKYQVFLEKTNKEKEELVNDFIDKKIASGLMDEWKEFGQATFQVVNKIGNENAFHRMILV